MKIKYLFTGFFFFITLLFIPIFRSSPQLLETYYSNGIYVFVATVLSYISSLVPFSLFDTINLILVLYVLIITFLIIFKKIGLKDYVRRLLFGLIYLFSAFLWLWGFNYYKPDIYHRLNFKQVPDNQKDTLFVEVFTQLAQAAEDNYLPPDFVPEQDSIDQSLEHSYRDLSSFLQIPYPCGKRRIKHITLSRLYAKSGILGYFGPWFSEVHINSLLSRWDFPMIMAHEKAHQFGIGGEGEANFYAWLVCSESSYRWNRYSASIFALSFFIKATEKNGDKQKFISMINPKIMQDILARSHYWSNLKEATMQNVGNKINDTYLKTSGVKKGIKDYNGIVKLILSYRNL